VPERRLSRFALEVLFLVALAAALTFADLKPLEVVGAMLLGWVFVALFEWASMRSESHFGSGLPPRYFVPRVSQPPSLPLDRADARFPVAQTRGDDATWLLPRAAEDGDEWPWRPEGEPQPVDEEAESSEPGEDVTSVATAAEAEAVVQEPVEIEAEVVEREEEEVEPPLLVEPASADGAPLAAPGAVVAPTARHHIDPLQPPGRRRRRRDVDDGMIEVPARPPVRVPPGASRREE
jgi:hypothetical protein